MAKRTGDEMETDDAPLKNGERAVPSDPKDQEMGDFEDDFEDEYESEDSDILEAGVDGRPDDEREAEEKKIAANNRKQTFLPGRHKLAAGESLAPDPSTYDMLHTLTSSWPCLSFDILRDHLGDKRKNYPATVYAVAGTQADSNRSKENELMVMKMSSLSRMDRLRDQDSGSDEDSSSDAEDADPILETRSIPQTSVTNRIRAFQSPSSSLTLTASTMESGELLIHDIGTQLRAFDTPGTVIRPEQRKPVATLTHHGRTEGFALDWSPHFPTGKLLSGDNDGRIFISTRNEDGTWTTDRTPFLGHQGSIEDLHWSPNERSVFASASSDGTVKVWDTRSKAHKPAVSVQVSSTDVNVISWSKHVTHLLASGHDDGSWSVWDLRQWKPEVKDGPDLASTPKPVASFDFHKEQITSLEWHPAEDSIMCVAAGDNTVTLWDLAVELDDEESRETAGVPDVPPQLLFVHYMEMVKEARWHPQIPGTVMATGGSGFGVFKTISI